MSSWQWWRPRSILCCSFLMVLRIPTILERSYGRRKPQGAIQSSPPEPYESFFDSRLQKLSGVRDPKLFHHIRSVRLDGFDADFQPSADLSVLQAIPN